MTSSSASTVESCTVASTVSLLGEMGYRAEPHPWEFGDVQVVWRQDDAWVPASDPRDRGDARVILIEE